MIFKFNIYIMILIIHNNNNVNNDIKNDDNNNNKDNNFIAVEQSTVGVKFMETLDFALDPNDDIYEAEQDTWEEDREEDNNAAKRRELLILTEDERYEEDYFIQELAYAKFLNEKDEYDLDYALFKLSI